VPPSVEDLDKVLDAYEFIEILGKGGMGAVYKARQISLDRIVAIKILPRFDDGVGDEFRFADRFQREARSMAKLSHPHITSVYDFGQTADGQLYFVMEFIDGTDLHDIIRSGQLTVEHVYGWMPQICAALEYAHQQGIVHRDIKPANIMITHEGNVKVADFGLAKLSGPTDEQSRLTMENVAMGTPAYVAPEALEAGVEPDHRADLYSLGVMLYEMLTGKIPRGMFRMPSELNDDLDPRIDDLVGRVMESDRESRFQHASEISTALETIRTTPAVDAAVEDEGPRTVTGAKLITGAAATAPVASTGVGAVSAESELVEMAAAPDKSKLPMILGVVALVATLAVLAVILGGGDDDGETGGEMVADAGFSNGNGATSTPGPRPDALTAPAPVPEPESEPLPSATAEATLPALPTEPSPEPDSPNRSAVAVEVAGPRHLNFHSAAPAIRVDDFRFDRRQPWTLELLVTPDSADREYPKVASFDGLDFVIHPGDDPAPSPLSDRSFWHVYHIDIVGGPAPAGHPAHLVFQHDGEKLRTFVNGHPHGTADSAEFAKLNAGEPLVIGGGLRGVYDEFRFSDVARYDGAFDPPARFEPDDFTSLLFHMDEAGDSQEVIVDSSRNGMNGRLVGEGWTRMDGDRSPGRPPAETATEMTDATSTRPVGKPEAEFSAIPPGEAQQQIASRDEFVAKRYAEGAGEIFAAAISELNGNFSKALERERVARSKAGDLDGVVTVRQLINALKKSPSEPLPPTSGDDAPASLVKLRDTYDGVVASHLHTRDNAIQELLKSYDQSLGAAETQLTKEGKEDQALIVRRRRLEVAAAGHPALPKIELDAEAVAAVHTEIANVPKLARPIGDKTDELLASGQHGRLHGFGSFEPGRDLIGNSRGRLDLDIRDVVVLPVARGHLSYLQKDGTYFCGSGPLFPADEEPVPVKKVQPSYRTGLFGLTEKGKVVHAVGVGTYLADTNVAALSDVVDIASAQWQQALLRADGSVAAWRSSQPKAVVETNVTAEKFAAIYGAGENLLFGRKVDGQFAALTKHPGSFELAAWLNGLEGAVTRLSCNAFCQEVLALTGHGKVHVFHENGEVMYPVPDDLPTAIDVRAGFNVHAARLEDGTWRAWGNNKNGIVDRVAQFPADVFDVVLTEGYVYWVE